MTIRSANGGDAEALVPLVEQLGYLLGASDLRRKVLELADRSGDGVWVAEDRGELVGFVSVHLTPLFHAPGFLGRVTALVVADARRRRGIGRLLMERAELFCWAAGCERLELTSGDHRPSAHAFYQSLGFRSDSRRFIKHRPPDDGDPSPPTEISRCQGT